MNKRPSVKQLRYLRLLAEQTGQTFASPATSAEASREITRLKATTPSTRTERYVERKLIADQIATGPVHDATQIRADELTGHGSTATWIQNHDENFAKTNSQLPRAPGLRPTVGARTELGRYVISEGQRILYGQRIGGTVRVTDRPVGHSARSYVIEREMRSKAELDALIADYKNEAKRHDAVPMNPRRINTH